MKPSRLGLLLATLAIGVLAHGIVRQLGVLDLCGWWTARWQDLLADGEAAAQLADATVLAMAIAGLPLLVGIRSRPLTEAVAELILAPLGAALAVVLVAWPLGMLVEATGSLGWVVLGAFLLLAVGALLAGGCARRIGTLVWVEVVKVSRGRLLWGGVLLSVGITWLAVATHDPAPRESAWTGASIGMRYGFWTAEIFALVLGATMLAAEIGQGTMKMILPHAYRRAEWVAAKAVTLVLCAVVLGASVYATGLLAGGELGDVMQEAVAGFGEETQETLHVDSGTMHARLAATTTAATASLVASALIGLLLSALFQSLVPALSASFLVFITLRTGEKIFEFPGAITKAIYATYPDKMQKGVQDLGRALSHGWDETRLPLTLILAMLTGVLGLLVSMRLFSRRDIHG